jgi:hypothetical protein
MMRLHFNCIVGERGFRRMCLSIRERGMPVNAFLISAAISAQADTGTAEIG